MQQLRMTVSFHCKWLMFWILKEVDYTFLDTGSPSCSDSGGFRKLQCKEQGSAIRYSELYGKQGSNINFVKKIDANTFRCAPMKEAWKMKHWLVERCDRCCNSDECHGVTDATSIDLNVEGGKLVVSFDKRQSIYECTWKVPLNLSLKEL
jgi:diaminopimelate epimerase